MIFDHSVQTYLGRATFGWLATVGQLGQPSASLEEIFNVLSPNELVIAHIASPNSVRNITPQPRVCFSAMDIWIQKGVKIDGDAKILLPSHPTYETAAALLITMVQARFPIKAVIHITIRAVSPILAPSYQYYLEARETDLITAARQQYGVG